MILQSDDNSQWATSLESFLPEYTSVRCWNTIQCYQLIKRRTTLVLDNFCPIPNLKYAVHSQKEGRYYFREFQDIPLWLMRFYKTDKDWDSYDTYLNDFRRRVSDGNIYLLFTQEQIAETKATLERLYKSHFSNDGKLDYKIYIQLIEQSLMREDYNDKCKSLPGFRTGLHIMDEKIKELWMKNYKN
jgi:hypothetical protein